MQPKSKISSIWKDAAALQPYPSGVSLHSHTSCSQETLTFIHKMFAVLPGMGRMFQHYEHESRKNGFRLDFERAHWRPPLMPNMAYGVEQRQIQDLGLEALVSITDHDTIEAPMLLRTVASSRGIPVSLEWTVPLGGTEFHLGIHNLPASEGAAWVERFTAYTASPNVHELYSALRDLNDMPGVLVVLNHPMWDLHKVGRDRHRREVARLLEETGECIHAVELNGLRDGRENREAAQLARETGHLLISGGDRHSLEPSANINLTRAKNFREFVDEIRIDRRSHILFLPQYAKPWEQRILHATLDAVTDFPQFIEGWQRWDERVFHPDRNGDLQPLRHLWADSRGRGPWPLLAAIQFVRMGRSQTFSRTFSLAFPGAAKPHAELELL